MVVTLGELNKSISEWEEMYGERATQLSCGWATMRAIRELTAPEKIVKITTFAGLKIDMDEDLPPNAIDVYQVDGTKFRRFFLAL